MAKSTGERFVTLATWAGGVTIGLYCAASAIWPQISEDTQRSIRSGWSEFWADSPGSQRKDYATLETVARECGYTPQRVEPKANPYASAAQPALAMPSIILIQADPACAREKLVGDTDVVLTLEDTVNPKKFEGRTSPQFFANDIRNALDGPGQVYAVVKAEERAAIMPYLADRALLILQ